MSVEIVRIEDNPSFDGSEGLLAIIIRGCPSEYGTKFLTDPGELQQIGQLRHLAGWEAKPHFHILSSREIVRDVGSRDDGSSTHCNTREFAEILIIQTGCVEFQVFNSARHWVGRYILSVGDVIIQLKGGHSFKALTEFSAIEIKPGPHSPAASKVMFNPVFPGSNS